ncbi:hypothetical protein HY463_01535 [Candidatus Peregrinibacteria bacterium]|nr:hypothetical protein [Candidatus Peregrinibacteria bacterium]
MAEKTLEVLGGDGVLTNVDIVGALEHSNPPELRHYFVRAAQFIHERTGLELQMTFDGIKAAILEDIFPNRGNVEYWHEFGQGVKIAPAVDHMLITPFAVRKFLNKILHSLAPSHPIHKKISAMLSEEGSPWEDEMYQFASEKFWDQAIMDPDAIEAIDYALEQDNPIVVATNSAAEKIVKLLLHSGKFPENRIIRNAVAPGKIGIYEDVRKYEVNFREPHMPGSRMNLKPFGVPVTLDLRRSAYRDALSRIWEESGAALMDVIDSIPEFLAPVPFLLGEEEIDQTVFLKLRRTSNTTLAQTNLARALKANISGKLTRLTDA